MNGARKIAEALLHGVGGGTVLLHIPAPAIATDLGEQVGLGTPAFQDVEIGPAVFRTTWGTDAKPDEEQPAERELLVSAAAVEKVVGSIDSGSAAVLFASAAGVLVNGTLMRIVSVAAVEGFGTVYLYRLRLASAMAALG